MTQALDPLILDFLDWLGPAPRPYGETMEAWRSSCPRLTVWEEAAERGLVERVNGEGGAAMRATAAGRALLAQSRQF